jgi:hypothetical protein
MRYLEHSVRKTHNSRQPTIWRNWPPAISEMVLNGFLVKWVSMRPFSRDTATRELIACLERFEYVIGDGWVRLTFTGARLFSVCSLVFL